MGTVEAMTAVLVVNVGSGTVVIHLYDLADLRRVAFDGVAPRWRADITHHTDPPSAVFGWGAEQRRVTLAGTTVGSSVATVLEALPRGRAETTSEDRPEVVAVAHRIVHGGELGDRPRRIDDTVVDAIEAAADAFAPIHNPIALAAVRETRARFPDAAHIALFDTAFHSTIPDAMRTYALPASWRTAGLRQQGFHGISHREVATRAARRLGRPVERCELLTVHLGGGCSAAAVRHGRSVATTMGTTPNAGMVMAARSGTVDPGLLLHLQERDDLTADDMRRILSTRSGLIGLTGGTTGDIARVRELAEQGAEEANFAIDVYVAAARREIAGLRPALDELHAITFTGGAALGNPWLVARICASLGSIGVATDRSPDGAPRIVLRGCEEAAMAAEVASMLP